MSEEDKVNDMPGDNEPQMSTTPIADIEEVPEVIETTFNEILKTIEEQP